MNDINLNEPITNPRLEDCHKLIDLLAKGWYLRSPSTHEPEPSFTDFHVNGVVVEIHSDRQAAEKLVQHGASAHEMDVEIARITGLWDFFQECAFLGFEGLRLDVHYPLDFYNRLTDMDRRLPTLARIRFPNSVNDLRGFFFGRLGLVEIESGTTVKWLDYEKFDKASNRYVLHGYPLPESIEAHSITGSADHPDVDGHPIFFKNGASFLGPYVSDLGAVPIFSSDMWAAYFAQTQGLLDSHQPISQDTAVDELTLKEDYRVARVDLFEFLERIHSDHGQFGDIGLNPLCHRYRQGWFFKHNDTWMLQTISGIWELTTQGEIKARNDVLPYKSYLGSVAESESVSTGISTMIETPFKRIAGADRSLMSEDDANTVLDRELSTPFDPVTPEREAVPPVDAFVMDAFDKITGGKAAWLAYGDDKSPTGFLIFPDMIAAAAYLIHEVLPHDEETRLHGYHPQFGPGAPGSHDPDQEIRITAGVTAAIRKTVFDALVNGYKPEHAFHLKRLMQDVTATFEVTEIGYFGDLLFYGTADGGEVRDRVDLEDEENARLDAKLKSAEARIQDRHVGSAEFESHLRRSLGKAFDLLAPDSRVIAATIVDEFDRTGRRTNYDYSGISMKAAKLIERELTIRVFRPWRDMIRESHGKDDLRIIREQIDQGSPDRTETNLIDWVVGKRKSLDLGGMRFCLKEIRELGSNTPMRKLLGNYLKTLSGGAWLISPEFESALQDISDKYRNGGVHDHLVSYDVCSEAVERVLLGPEPLLKRLVESSGESRS